MNSNSQVVVTGVGVVTPIGIGTDAFWDSMVNGQSGVVLRPEFAETDWPFKIAGLIEDFDGKKFVKPRKAMKVMCRPIQFGFAAAMMATEQAGLQNESVDPDRIGTVFGSEPFYCNPTEVAEVFSRCVENKVYDHDKWGDNFMREIQPLWMLKYLPNMVASHISIGVNARGPSNSICQSDASSILSMIEGISLIQRGLADVVIVGGTGSPLSITGLLYHGQDHLSHRIDEPELACRPFDADRDGQVVGEGAGAIVLESAEHARNRQANILCHVEGWGRGFCGQGNSFSESIKTILESSLAQSGLAIEQIGHVNANGSGSVQLDQAEANAIHQVLGKPRVLAPKANFGNLGPATGAVELVASILALKKGILPPSINHSRPDPDCPVITSSDVQSLTTPYAAKISFSDTGQVTSLVFKKGD